MSWLMVVLIGVVSLVTNASAFAGEGRVALVDALEGDAGDIQIVRRGQPLEALVRRFDPLLEGDRIVVVDNARLMFRVGAKMQIWVDKTNSPYVVRNVTQPPPLLMDLLDRAATLIAEAVEPTAPTPVMMALRAGDLTHLSVPLLDTGGIPVRFAAGRRPFCIAWRGGAGLEPFVLTLQRLDGAVAPIRQEGLAGGRGCSAEAQLASGRYRVSLAAASGETVEAEVEAIAGAELPVMPSELLEAGLSVPTLATLRATWLLDNPGDWIFEAYQQVAPLAAYEPARRLRAAIERLAGS